MPDVGSDYSFHLARPNGLCPPTYTQQQCDNYPPLAKYLFILFSINDFAFFTTLSLIAFFIIPLLIYRISKNLMAIYFYFSISALPFFVITMGHIPQILVLLFLLLLVLFRKNLVISFILILLAISAHNSGFYLLMSAWIIFFIFDSKKGKDLIYLGCSLVPQSIGEQLKGFEIPLHYRAHHLYFGYLPVFFIRDFNIIPFVLAIKQLIKKAHFEYVFLIALFFVWQLFTFHRTLVMAAPFLCIGLADWYNEQRNSKAGKGLILLSLFLFILNYVSWTLNIAEGFGFDC